MHSRFVTLVNTLSTSERDVLNFINTNEAFFIIGSILKNNYRFGHHELFLFPEFKLETSFQAEYLLVGKNSQGYHFVFVELENVYENIVTQKGEFGNTIKKGIAQAHDWERWIQTNFHSLKIEFEKCQNTNIVLPNEFRDFDRTRTHFALVAGRRADYRNEKTRWLTRKEFEDAKILIMHYDNLLESSSEVIGEFTY